MIEGLLFAGIWIAGFICGILYSGLMGLRNKR